MKRPLIPSRRPSDRLANDARTKLRSMILGAEFKPGQRLVEDDLSVILGVGRTPVREALLQLQGEGFIERERGWIVHDVDPSKVHSIFESRAAIEGAVARLAADRIERPVWTQLESSISAMRKTASRTEINRVNSEFHQLIVATANNALLAEFHERTQFQYWMLRIPIMFSDQQIADTIAQHCEIVDALRRHDADLAERAARAHVEATMKIVVPALAR